MTFKTRGLYAESVCLSDVVKLLEFSLHFLEKEVKSPQLTHVFCALQAVITVCSLVADGRMKDLDEFLDHKVSSDFCFVLAHSVWSVKRNL